MRILAPLLASLLLASCAAMEKTESRIPTETVAARSPGNTQRLVIVLPGRGDDLAALKATGIAAAIQESLPDAEILLAGITMAYYQEGRSVQRLHEEIVAPARQRGFREIYLAGASMGGMGVLLYEREYPGQMSALVLMAPFMGDGALIEEIKAAGGLQRWNAGPVPAQVNGDNVGREEWRVAQSWLANPARARNVWLICGQQDQFHGAASMIAPLLPAQNYQAPQGGHAWRVWTPAAARAFAQIGSAR
jgi:enterochelin esterase-like enzyme